MWAKWKTEAGIRGWAHLICNTVIFVEAGLSQSPVWSLLTSLGIGVLTRDEVSVRLWVTLSRRRLGYCFDVCIKGLWIYASRIIVGVKLNLSNSFTETQTWRVMFLCEAFFMKILQWKFFFFFPISVISDTIVVCDSPQPNSLIVITAGIQLLVVRHFNQGTNNSLQSVANGLPWPHRTFLVNGRHNTNINKSSKKFISEVFQLLIPLG